MSTVSNCLFCKIKSKEISSAEVYEDGHTLAFLDVHPRAPGHTVVISKFHSQNLLDLPDDEIGRLFLAVKKVAEQITGALSADGLTIGINQGWASGQTVDHLHVHIIPRFNSDRGGSIHSVVNNPPKESLEEIASKIKNQKIQ